MSELDLDINNYEIADLETFFRLPITYDEHSIAKKENEIRTLLLSSGHIAKHFKRDLIIFLEEGKKRLIQAKIQAKVPTTIYRNEPPVPDNFPIPVNPLPPQEEVLLPRKETSYVYTQNSEYFPGTLNPLDRRTLEKCISIDSRFRPPMTLNSDFTISLPSKLQKVLSMECASFEIDRHSIYNISSSLNNNFIYISVCAVEQEYNQIFIVPDGHYDLDVLLNTLNRMLLDQENTPFVLLQWKKDPYDSNKCILMINQDSENDFFTQRIRHISLDFTLNIDGNFDKFEDYTSKMGYLLGFTKKTYTGETQYMGEIPVRMFNALPYFYLAVDDFQNRSNACFQPAYSHVTMSPSILSRIALKEQEAVEILSTPRTYFGPVDLSRFQIRLYDVHGKLLQMDSNYSFCLKFNSVYDL